MLIYPAIDLQDGRCVRLFQGRFDAVTAYDADPRVRLQAFADEGAEWVHVVDLDGARDGAPRQHALIGELARAGGVKVQAGGGVRTDADIARLLEAGASRVVVGSAAVDRPGDFGDWLNVFGRDCLVAALDVRLNGGEPEVATRGWTQGSGVTLWEALERLRYGGLRHLLVTDVARDGALAGPNLDLIAAIRARRPDLQLQASGGVRSLDDLGALASTGAAGAIVGKALYEGLFTLREAIGAR